MIKNQIYKKLFLIFTSLSGLMGVSGLLGSINAFPIQIGTTICLILSSCSLFFSYFQRSFLAVSFSLCVAISALSSLLHYLLGWNLGIGFLFSYFFLLKKEALHQNISLDAAIAFLYVQMAFLLSFSKKQAYSVGFSAVFVACGFAAGLSSFLGHVLQIEEVLSWKALPYMTIYTSVGILTLSLALFLRILFLYPEKKTTRWMFIPLTVVCSLVANDFFRAFEVESAIAASKKILYFPNPITIFLIILFAFLTIYTASCGSILVARSEEKEEKTEKDLALKEKVLRYVSHEIRNPLSAIIGFSDTSLQNAKTPEEAKELLDSIYVASSHVKAVLDDLLAHSRFQSGQVRVYKEEIYLKDWIKKLLFIFQKRAEARQVGFFFHEGENLPEKFLSDPSKLFQILINLFENSLRHTAEKGEIHLSILFKEGSLIFSIKDNGKGIPKDLHDQIFSPFFQVQPSDQKLGLGLGLSICKGFIDMMGGDIHLESELDKGTEFIVEVKEALK